MRTGIVGQKLFAETFAEVLDRHIRCVPKVCDQESRELSKPEKRHMEMSIFRSR